MTPDGVLEYRVTQLEKRAEEHEKAVGQIRDAIISVREDSREVRSGQQTLTVRIGEMEKATVDAARRRTHDGEFRWTKWQVATAGLIGVAMVVLQVVTAFKR